jgi:hypothetical protein
VEICIAKAPAPSGASSLGQGTWRIFTLPLKKGCLDGGQWCRATSRKLVGDTARVGRVSDYEPSHVRQREIVAESNKTGT